MDKGGFSKVNYFIFIKMNIKSTYLTSMNISKMTTKPMMTIYTHLATEHAA